MGRRLLNVTMGAKAADASPTITFNHMLEMGFREPSKNGQRWHPAATDTRSAQKIRRAYHLEA